MPTLPTVITAAQARAYGYSRHAVAHRLQRGLWRSLLRGVYLTHGGTPSGREWARAAVLLPQDKPAVLSGAAGLHCHGLHGRFPGPGLLVLVPNDCGRRSCGPVTIRHAATMPRSITVHPQIAVAMVARCVVDACIGVTDLQTVRSTVATAVQAGRCFIDDVQQELEHVTRRGTHLLRQAIAEVLDGAASVAEAEVAALMSRGGIRGFAQNVDVFGSAGQWLARADFYWEELAAILEIDSREWHFDPQSWQATLQRHNQLELHGYTVLHCTPGQIRRDPAAFLQQIRAWLARRSRSISG